MLRSQLDSLINKPKNRQVLSTGLLTWLNNKGRCVNRVVHLRKDTLHYTYNTFSQVDLPETMSMNDLTYRSLCFIKDEGYRFNINMCKKGGSMTISKDDFSWTVKHKHFYRVVLACAEIVFRLKYPFLPTRSDFLTRKVDIIK